MTITVRRTPFRDWALQQRPASIHAVVVARDPGAAGTRTADRVRTFGQMLATVLVPGAHVVIRETVLTQDETAAGLRAAGFEIRGCIQRIDAEGIGHTGDGGTSLVDGFPGVQLWPVNQHEPWVLARWPCSEPTVAANLRRWHAGALKRLNAKQPFPDVMHLDLETFVNVLVSSILPLGVGTFLDPVALTTHTTRAVEAAEIEDAVILATDATAYGYIQGVLDETYETHEQAVARLDGGTPAAPITEATEAQRREPR